MSSTLRKRPTATVKEGEEAEVILDGNEQEGIVADLINQAETAQKFWLPPVGYICLAACLVPFFLPSPEYCPTILLRLLTIPPLLFTALTLIRPELASLFLPTTDFNHDYLLVPPTLAAGLVVYLNGDVLSERTWGWTIPAATVGLAREVQGSLKAGLEQARKMREVMYNAPTA